MIKFVRRKHPVPINILTFLVTLLLLALTFSSILNLIDNKTENKAIAANGLTEITYQPSNEDFANPERGFMKQSWIWPDQSFDPYKIRAKEPSDSVVWVYFRLDNYRYEDGVLRSLESLGSGRGLDVVKSTFQAAREKGLKLVIRFIYNWGPGWTNDPNQASPDVPLHVAKHHIDQLMPVVADNIDVVAAMQVGFVGHWGEWHSSKYLYTLESRKAIVDALLNTLPKERMLLLRVPRYKEIWYQGPLTTSEAFSQSDASRVGHHNDCFLVDGTDAGTYRSQTSQPPKSRSDYCDGQSDVAACWKDFIAQEGRFTPVGGETCGANPPRSECTSALGELEMMHWSFINNGYHPDVLNSWKIGGCWDEIRRRLGYRFALSRLAISQQVNPGGTMAFNLELKNEGFTSPYNQRPVFLVLKNNSGGSQRVISLESADPRWWMSGQTTNVDTEVPIPADLPEGTYSVYLWLPDASQNLRDRPEYAIRLANQNVWQPATGFNLLFDNLIISGGPVPTPTPTPTPPPCAGPEDVDCDGDVDVDDVLLILQNWLSPSPDSSRADTNSDGKVNGVDFGNVIKNLTYQNSNHKANLLTWISCFWCIAPPHLPFHIPCKH